MLEWMNTQKLQSSVQMARQVKLLMDDGDYQINRYRDPDLSLHRIGAVSEKVLDAQVAFDPAKEEFNRIRHTNPRQLTVDSGE